MAQAFLRLSKANSLDESRSKACIGVRWRSFPHSGGFAAIKLHQGKSLSKMGITFVELKHNSFPYLLGLAVSID